MNDDYYLIVDDQPSTLETLVNIAQTTLKDAKVAAASDGEQAVRVLNKILERGDLPVAAICDYKLWPGIEQGKHFSGIDVLALVKEECPDTVRILYSAYGRDANIIINAIRSADIHDFMVKTDDEITPEGFKEKLIEWNKLRSIRGHAVRDMKGLAQCDSFFLDVDFINGIDEVRRLKEAVPDLQLGNLEDPYIRARNIEIMKKTSKLMYNIITDKGGWIMPEQNYRQDIHYLTEVPNHVPETDKLVTGCKSAQSLRTRFEYATTDLLPPMIRKHLDDKGSITIGSFGSGQGSDILKVLSYFPEEVEEGRIRCGLIDLDPLAISVGERFRDSLG
jgi:hypothetical protein